MGCLYDFFPLFGEWSENAWRVISVLSWCDEVCVARQVVDSTNLYLKKQLLYKMVGTDLLQNRLLFLSRIKTAQNVSWTFDENSDRFK